MKPTFDTSIILKSKILKILIILGVAFLLYVFHFYMLAFILVLVAIFLGFVYRNPERYVYRNEAQILCPIDGTVDAIDGNRIFINMSLCNCSVVRMPEDGMFTILEKHNGIAMSPFMPKAKLLNERISVGFNKLKLEFFSGCFNDKYEFYNQGFELSKGDRIGSLVHGLAILTLDESMEPCVKLGQQIKAAETTLCKVIKG